MFATKHPNVPRRSYGTLAEGERSTIIPMSGFGNIFQGNGEYINKGGNPEYPNH
nr:MAG TPA: hypothetical protein [Bacteriophage sp.]